MSFSAPLIEDLKRDKKVAFKVFASYELSGVDEIELTGVPEDRAYVPCSSVTVYVVDKAVKDPSQHPVQYTIKPDMSVRVWQNGRFAQKTIEYYLASLGYKEVEFVDGSEPI